MCLIYLIAAPFYLFYAFLSLEVAGTVGGLAAAAVIPGCYILSMFRVLALRPADLPAPRWFPEPPAGGEPAELSYFYGVRSPAVAEVEHVATLALVLARQAARTGWRHIKRTAFLERAFGPGTGSAARRLLLVPPTAGAIAGGAVGLAFGAVLFAVIALVHAVVATGVFAVMWAAGLLLRAVDTALLRIRNVRMTCPACFERVSYPAYQCPAPGCEERHSDVRPGQYGILRRYCRCGASLPTLLLLGSARLPAYCPHAGCGRPMEHRPGEAREVVLPFFGAAGAGKTRLLYGIVTLLQSAPGLTAEFADSATGATLTDVRALLAPGRAPAKTTTALPRGQILRVTTSSGDTRLLQFYDSAGELFYQTERTQELGYLTKARTFVLVIDPLSVPSFWQSLSPQRQEELRASRSTAPPDLAYQQTHQQMEAMGVQLKKSRLAVVFSRADLLGEPRPESVAAWAEDTLGLDNLVRSVRHQFGEAEFFRTACVLDNGTLHSSVLELARWIVARDGITLAGPQPSGRIG